jgi:hypothetical protein
MRRKRFNDVLQNRVNAAIWNQGGCKIWYLDACGRNTKKSGRVSPYMFRRKTRRFDAAACTLECESAAMRV